MPQVFHMISKANFIVSEGGTGAELKYKVKGDEPAANTISTEKKADLLLLVAHKSDRDT